MFDLIKPWPFRATANRPLRFNRVVLSFEDLETRALLSPGVIPATTADAPLSALTIAADAGNTQLVRAPIPIGSPSNGTTGSAGQLGASTLAPIVNTTLGTTLPGVNGATALLPGPSAIPLGPGTAGGTLFGGQTPLPGASSLLAPLPVVLPGQGTLGGVFIGGQILLPGVVTTPPTPAEPQIRLAIINTADPYAAFEQTILTKEGERTASGDSQGNNPQNRALVRGAFEEEEGLDRLASDQARTDDQAALNPRRTAAFFADSAWTGEDNG